MQDFTPIPTRRAHGVISLLLTGLHQSLIEIKGGGNTLGRTEEVLQGEENCSLNMKHNFFSYLVILL